MHTRNWILCYYEITREHTKAVAHTSSVARARKMQTLCLLSTVATANGDFVWRRASAMKLVWRATKRAATNEKLYDFLRLVQQRISQIPTKSRCGEKVALNIQSIGNNWRSLTWLVQLEDMFRRQMMMMMIPLCVSSAIFFIFITISYPLCASRPWRKGFSHKNWRWSGRTEVSDNEWIINTRRINCFFCFGAETSFRCALNLA